MSYKMLNGVKMWYRGDQWHREDGPALEYPCGGKEWFLNDHLHREDGPAIETARGSKAWYLYSRPHRKEGPAIDDISEGKQMWYLHGKPYLAGEIKCITIAMLPLDLPPYILLWIFEWSHPKIMQLNQPKLVALLEGLRNSRNKIKTKGWPGGET